MNNYYVVANDSILEYETLFNYNVIRTDVTAKVRVTARLVEVALLEQHDQVMGGTENFTQIINPESGDLSHPILSDELFSLIQSMVLLVSCGEDEVVPPLWRATIKTCINTIVRVGSMSMRSNVRMDRIVSTTTPSETQSETSAWIGARQTEEGFKFYAKGKLEIPSKYNTLEHGELSLYFWGGTLAFRRSYSKFTEKIEELTFQDGIDMIKTSVTEKLSTYNF